MSNVARLQNSIRESGIPAIVITSLPSVRWLTGFTGSFGLAVVTHESGIFITDSRYTIQATEECVELPSVSFRNPTNVVDFLHDQLRELGITQFAFDHNHVTVSQLTRWSETLQGIEFTPVDDPIEQLRQIKTTEEIARIQKCCRVTDEALERLVGLLRPGITELALLWDLQDFLRSHDATLAFDPIIVSGERTARPHGDPSEKEINKGEFVTFDIGARIDGYCSDITRTVVMGPATDRQHEVYNHLLKAQVACIDAMRPGAIGKEVDGLARSILDEKDLGQYFGHGLGHGLGALVHDTGRLSPIVDQTIQVGQVWTIEPGVYIEGFGGMRIEDDIVVTEGEPDILTGFPKDLIEVSC